MPTNQYGVGDNFNMETAHLLPMILRRFHLAKMLQEGNVEAIKSDLKKYKLIIHCGACMLTQKEMENRYMLAKEQNIPITNYGIAIAKIHGILEKVIAPFK